MKKSIIICDTETTGLCLAEGADLIHQPFMTEIYCHKVTADKKLKKIDNFHSLVKPPIPIPFFITKKTGIDDYTLKKAPPFMEIYMDLALFFLGCVEFVAHNASFDINIIRYELQRIGKEFNFPFPVIHYCTAEKSRHLKGIRLKNEELSEIVTGIKKPSSHRAKDDVLDTFKNYKLLKKMENK